MFDKHRILAIGLATAFLTSHWSNIATKACAQTKPKVDIKGKIVIANLDRYPAHFRVGKVKKQVAPKKASLLSPKRFPVTIDVWNGIRGRAAYERQTIAAAGIYVFQFRNGRWNLTRHTPRRRATSRTPSRVTRTRPTVRRSTGSRSRVVRGSGRYFYGGRIPLLRRVAGDVLWLYRFVRDEEDRDLIRDIIIGKEIDKAIEDEILDKLDKMAVNLPAYERGEFTRALRDLNSLSEKDIQDLGAATNDEWDKVRDSLGSAVTDNAWKELESDFSDLDVGDLSERDLDLEGSGVDSLDSNLDLGDLDGGDADLGDLGGALDNLDLDDLGGGIDDIDIGDLGGGFGGGDFGGGFGGDFGGGGFDYDAGGFDDFGGGFDDFGGGGFDDFGGGFDDF